MREIGRNRVRLTQDESTTIKDSQVNRKSRRSLESILAHCEHYSADVIDSRGFITHRVGRGCAKVGPVYNKRMGRKQKDLSKQFDKVLIDNDKRQLTAKPVRIPKWTRKYNLKKKYGLTLSDYEDKIFEQKGKCAICETSFIENGKRLAVDHCHKSGKVRGLLCALCNTGLGSFKDSPRRLVLAAKYLMKYQTS